MAEMFDLPAKAEKVLTCCHTPGPFLAHIVDGVWIKSTPIKKNLPVGNNAYALRNRLYSPDRIRYPLKRVDFDPQTNRNTHNRGKSKFVRISWEEAFDLVSSELERVKRTNGSSAILHSHVSHQWIGALHRNNVWANNFFTLLGGCTRLVGGTSWTGWRPAGLLMTGLIMTFFETNNASDILKNTKLIIHWATDVAANRFREYRQNFWLRRFKEAGIKQIVIDPYFNDTAALYGDEWIPILPGTDEALMAALAYVLITEDLCDKEFIATHTVGFQRFKEYIMGGSDGVRKTPEWAAPICGVDSGKIYELAREWGSKPTYILCDYGGANRRYGAAEWCRMIMTMQALLGNIGRPGRGFGQLTYDARGVGQRPIPAIIPSMKNPVAQVIRHAQFSDAILNPPIKWTATSEQGIEEEKYPAEGCSEIKLIAFMSDSGSFLNQIPETTEHIRALQSPKVEFVYCHAAWWNAAPKFADVILPIRHIGEREDIANWENYTIYMNALVEPQGEPKNDLDIFIELAKRLGFEKELTQGKSPEQWLREIYQRLELPLTFEEFKERGFYEYPMRDDAPTVLPEFRSFYEDPEKYKLRTPSGKIEIYSKRVADFFGDEHPSAATIPKYLPSPEGPGSPLSVKYPLFLTSPHQKLAENSQWLNLSWHRDEYQMIIKGYSVMRINPADAENRGLKSGDIVRIFNGRGSILCATYITERIMPSVIRVCGMGWYTPMKPGDPDSLDVGGNPNVLISGMQPDPLCDGLVTGTRVDVEKWR